MSWRTTALRGLQMLDQVAALEPEFREELLAAQSELGSQLGLVCTGAAEPGGFNHSGDTCPVHEWLVADDYEAARRAAARRVDSVRA